MSFQYMPLFTGDYLRDTQHLSCSEHGIYLKLLMHCWDQKGPAPLDERKLSGIVNARSSDEVEAMRRVLSEFFVQRLDGHYNVRMQREVERSEAISGIRSEAGKAGYQAKAKHLLSKSQASATTIPPSPDLTPDHKPRKTRNTQPPAPPTGVTQISWDDWLKIRKVKRSPWSDTAWEEIQKQFAVAGLSIPDGIRECCARSWASFRADWYMKDKGHQSMPAWKAERVDMVAKHFPNIAEKKNGTTFNVG